MSTKARCCECQAMRARDTMVEKELKLYCWPCAVKRGYVTARPKAFSTKPNQEPSKKTVKAFNPLTGKLETVETEA